MATVIKPITKLEAKRKAMGLSRYRLAKNSGIHRDSLLRIELHGQKPSYGTRLALSLALGCQPEDLKGYVDADG